MYQIVNTVNLSSLLVLVCLPLQSRWVDSYVLTHRIVITGQIQGHTYCLGDGQVNVLRLKVQFNIKNENAAPVAIYTGSPELERVSIAKSEQAMRSGTYESDTSLTVARSQSRNGVSEKFLSVVQSGDAVSIEIPQLIPVLVSTGTGHDTPPGILSEGTYIVRLSFTTWPIKDQTETADWTRRILPQASLVTVPLVSDYIRLIVNTSEAAVKCN